MAAVERVVKARDAMHFVSLRTDAEPRREVTFARPKPVNAMMHVRLWQDGRQVRHRIMIDEAVSSSGSWTYAAVMNGRTACDVTIADKYYAPVDAGLDGELCSDGCFTKPELLQAERLRVRAEERRHAQAVKDEAEREASNQRALTESRERVRRYVTTETEVEKPEPEEKP